MTNHKRKKNPPWIIRTYPVSPELRKQTLPGQPEKRADGAHLSIAKEILSLRTNHELTRLKFIMGGTIPKDDVQTLLNMGVDLIATQHKSIDEIVGQIITLASK